MIKMAGSPVDHPRSVPEPGLSTILRMKIDQRAFVDHRIVDHRLVDHRIVDHRIVDHRLVDHRIVDHRLVAHNMHSSWERGKFPAQITDFQFLLFPSDTGRPQAR